MEVNPLAVYRSEKDFIVRGFGWSVREECFEHILRRRLVGLHLPAILMTLKVLQRDKEWFGLELQFRDCLAFDMAKPAWPSCRRELCSDTQYRVWRAKNQQTHHLMGESPVP
jgi:hypothetical protein